MDIVSCEADVIDIERAVGAVATPPLLELTLKDKRGSLLLLVPFRHMHKFTGSLELRVDDDSPWTLISGTMLDLAHTAQVRKASQDA